MHLTESPGLIVQKMDFLDNTLELCLLNFENFSKSLLFCSFVIFKRTPNAYFENETVDFLNFTIKFLRRPEI